MRTQAFSTFMRVKELQFKRFLRSFSGENRQKTVIAIDLLVALQQP